VNQIDALSSYLAGYDASDVEGGPGDRYKVVSGPPVDSVFCLCILDIIRQTDTYKAHGQKTILPDKLPKPPLQNHHNVRIR